MLTIVDTMTVFAVHGMVATETAANDKRVQSVHWHQIAKPLPMECPLMVGRGQTFWPILLEGRRPTEEQVEAINVLTLKKRPHHLLVNHTMNVVLAHPPVEIYTQRQ